MRDRLISYFLADLPKEEEIQLEEEYFASDEKYLEFEAVQNDLIDAYVQDKLILSDREKFAKYLKATPGIRKRVEIAQALSKHINKLQEATVIVKNPSPPTVSWWQAFRKTFISFNLAWRFAFATSIAIIPVTILVIAWTRVEYQRLKQSIENQQTQLTIEKNQITEQEKLKQLELEKEIAKLSEDLNKEKTKSSKLEQQIASNIKPKESQPLVELSNNTTRGENKKKQTVKLPSQKIPFKLKLPKTSLRPTQIIIKDEDRQIVFQQDNLEKSAKQTKGFLIVEIPSNKLSRYSYILELNGIDKDGSLGTIQKYSFSIDKD